MSMNIIHPPSQLRREVDKKTSGGLKRLPIRNQKSDSLAPLRLSESFEQFTDSACRPPELFYWKRDLDSFFGTGKPAKTTTTYLEWKKAPKKRKKKKSGDGNSMTSESFVSQDDISMESSKRSTRSDRKYDRASRKENSPPGQFKPTFSHSRYSNWQKFRALSSYYREKQQIVEMEGRTERGSEGRDDLAAIKKELADLKRWATTKNDKSKGKKVQFAHPLISQLKYRPKTRPEDIDLLFFREDELLDWEEDRETTSPEFVELVISEDAEVPVHVRDH